MINDFYFFDFDEDKEIEGISFEFESNFRIIDKDNGYSVEISKVLKKYIKNNKKMEIVLNNSPFKITDISSMELSDFKINKNYKGSFIVNFYENDTFDIFLKNFI